MTDVLWWIIGILVSVMTVMAGVGLKAGLAYIKDRHRVNEAKESMVMEELGKIKTDIEDNKKEAEIAHKHIDRRIGKIFTEIQIIKSKIGL